MAELEQGNLDEGYAQAEEYLCRPVGTTVALMDGCRHLIQVLSIWPWMPGASGLDTLKTEALKR
ncbi:MAG: hypothetical protein IPJ38_00195 [Dechloromonas sp.]|uniref:Uncharacterized protein n=1 Tax=Candidatus Dechloromonas phosphorivorans TaxID=2899244 RepID=A0A935MXW6_9RHOO|nr:hypothetical protein [Candidatus Dechloromonas phosphorivorans]